MKKVTGVTDKVLKFAMEEFLEKGFRDASIRTIADRAETATGSIYRRFFDKEQIFYELVKPVFEGFKEWLIYEQELYADSVEDKAWDSMMDYTLEKHMQTLDYIYDNFDIFKLLVKCSGGTRYENFVHEISDIQTKYAVRYFEEVDLDVVSSGKVSERLIHMIHSAHFTAMLELVMHDVPKKQAIVEYKKLQRFISIGWNDLIRN